MKQAPFVPAGSRAGGKRRDVTVASDRNGVDQSASLYRPALIVARIFCSGARLRQADTASCKVGKSVRTPAPSFSVAGQFAST
jgi:hypothetical protein